MNLYFDGHTMVPDISVYAQDQTSLSFIPPFFADSANTLALEPYSFDGTLVPGSGVLVYTNGSFTVELTSFVFTSQFLYNRDRVGSFTTSPDGELDKVAAFTLTVTQQTVPFAAFTAKLDLKAGPSARKDSFSLNGTFSLGTGSNGIAPLTEAVSLALAGGTGAVTLTIPAGSFTRTGNGGFAFEGTINGVALEAQIRPIRGNQFTFKAEGTGANLTGIANPVAVTLTIGDDSGTTTVTAEIH
jgi:hypothetical protein